MASLLMLLTLGVVLLGVARLELGVGIALALLCCPAMLRTAWSMERKRQQGQAPSMAERVYLFASSLLVVFVIGLASGITFCTICFASGLGMFAATNGVNFVPLAVLFGLVPGIWVLIKVGRILWPRRE
jgi:hypothetical protein